MSYSRIELTFRSSLSSADLQFQQDIRNVRRKLIFLMHDMDMRFNNCATHIHTLSDIYKELKSKHPHLHPIVNYFLATVHSALNSLQDGTAELSKKTQDDHTKKLYETLKKTIFEAFKISIDSKNSRNKYATMTELLCGLHEMFDTILRTVNSKKIFQKSNHEYLASLITTLYKTILSTGIFDLFLMQDYFDESDFEKLWRSIFSGLKMPLDLFLNDCVLNHYEYLLSHAAAIFPGLKLNNFSSNHLEIIDKLRHVLPLIGDKNAFMTQLCLFSAVNETQEITVSPEFIPIIKYMAGHLALSILRRRDNSKDKHSIRLVIGNPLSYFSNDNIPPLPKKITPEITRKLFTAIEESDTVRAIEMIKATPQLLHATQESTGFSPFDSAKQKKCHHLASFLYKQGCRSNLANIPDEKTMAAFRYSLRSPLISSGITIENTSCAPLKQPTINGSSEKTSQHTGSPG